MASEQNGRRIVRFGDYEVDRDARELRLSGQRVPLQIQPFAVLEILVERAGEVVTRENLRARVWPATVYVDFDHGLNNAINRLRRALNESAESPREEHPVSDSASPTRKAAHTEAWEPGGFVPTIIVKKVPRALDAPPARITLQSRRGHESLLSERDSDSGASRWVPGPHDTSDAARVLPSCQGS
jgi:hypothetical protein